MDGLSCYGIRGGYLRVEVNVKAGYFPGRLIGTPDCEDEIAGIFYSAMKPLFVGMLVGAVLMALGMTSLGSIVPIS